MLTLADVYQSFNLKPAESAERIAISGVEVDSRQVRPGSLFVAMQGERHDGHEFIREAIQQGAAAVLAETRAGSLLSDLNIVDTEGHPIPELSAKGVPVFVSTSSLKALQRLAAHWRLRFPLCTMIGITGSVGKSSTKELVAAVLSRKAPTLKSTGNLNNEIGLPLTLFRLNETLAYAVVEMGMYDLGEIRNLCEIARPRIGIVTNVGPSHLERLGTIEQIAQAKSELVQALPADGIAILNGDDPLVRPMSAQTRAKAFFYGLNSGNDLWADSIESHGLEGISFDLHHVAEKMRVRVPLLGRHSVHTALAAAAVGLAEGMAWSDILSGLQDVSAQLRLIAVPGEKGTTILDDTYNASPDSSLAALNLLADLNGRKIAVLGDMLELGEYEEQGHQVVGGRAAQVVEVLITVGERGRWIGEAAREVGHRQTFIAETNARAVEILREVMQPGDMILVKGSRGAQMEQVVAAVARSTENGHTETSEWPGP